MSKKRQNEPKWTRPGLPKRKAIIEEEPVTLLAARPPLMGDLEAYDSCHSLDSLDSVDGDMAILDIGKIMIIRGNQFEIMGREIMENVANSHFYFSFPPSYHICLIFFSDHILFFLFPF